MRPISARHAGLPSCETCRLLSRPATAWGSRYPRCHVHIAIRRPANLARCGLFLLLTYVLYVTANLLPVMYTELLFRAQADTMLRGTMLLWATGAWPLAIIVFATSVIVPLAKLLVLTFLMLSVQLRSCFAPVVRVCMYRAVRFFGRWSMLDIFVATVLAAAVQVQSIASMRTGPGALAFAAVLIFTMFAAQAFDQRLIWDALEERHG